MNIGVLGTGMVATHLGKAFIAQGHAVKLGSRSATNDNAAAWVAETGSADASTGTFADAAAFGEVLFNCVAGTHAMAALGAAGPHNMDGKILVDVANPLDFSNGFPPFLSVVNTDSVGEQIQRAFPNVKVVKALNTVAHPLMTNPGSLADGDHTLLICGNDGEAKAKVTAWLRDWFGWKDVLDVGDIDASRGLEAWLLLWTRLWGKLGRTFSLKIVVAPEEN